MLFSKKFLSFAIHRVFLILPPLSVCVQVCKKPDLLMQTIILSENYHICTPIGYSIFSLMFVIYYFLRLQGTGIGLFHIPLMKSMYKPGYVEMIGRKILFEGLGFDFHFCQHDINTVS